MKISLTVTELWSVQKCLEKIIKLRMLLICSFISVELLSSMLNVGLGVGFLPGMFYDRFGPTLTSGAGLIVSVPILILIWSTTRHVNFYSNHAWLMSIYFLLMG